MSNNRNAYLNRFTVLGRVEWVKLKKSGTYIIHLRVSSRPDKPLPGTNPGTFTGVVLLRMQAVAVKRSAPSQLSFVPGAEVMAEGVNQGVSHRIAGEDYLNVEMWVHRLRLVRPALSSDEVTQGDTDIEDELITAAESDIAMTDAPDRADEGDKVAAFEHKPPQ